MVITDQPVALKAALRHDAIRRAIEVDGRVSIADLSDRLGVSEVTIREDLKHLEGRGVLKRVRGGAVVTRNDAMEMSLEETSTTNRAEKMAIAAKAASMVEDGQTIIIDVGSTTTEMAKALSPGLSRVVVITNGLNIALILEGLPGVSVIVTGGTLRPLQHSLVAPMGTLLLDQLKADIAFIGCNGVVPRRPRQDRRGGFGLCRRHLWSGSADYRRRRRRIGAWQSEERRACHRGGPDRS
jgi:DeoR family transcriptional regulator of aga operon